MMRRASTGGIIAWLWLASAAGAATEACPSHRVEVSDASQRDFGAVCEGARRAIDLMAGMGLQAGETLRVSVVDSADHPRIGASVGWFDAPSGVIRLLAFDTAVERTAANPPFGVPMDPEVYTSFVAHEIAHAVFHANFAGKRATALGHEYFAYAVQFESMSPALRERVLAAAGVEGYAREDEISLSYYLLAPHQFGAKCYLHYARPENGARFLRELVGDRALRRSF